MKVYVWEEAGRWLAYRYSNRGALLSTSNGGRSRELALVKVQKPGDEIVEGAPPVPPPKSPIKVTKVTKGDHPQ